MITVFEGDTADQVWRQAAASLCTSAAVQQSGRGGSTREILRAVLGVRSPRDRWVLSRAPPLNPAFAIAEVVWILAGSNSAPFVNHWNPVLPRFCGGGLSYHGAYGERLRKRFGLDQLERAAAALERNCSSRQVVLQLWDAAADLPGRDGAPRAADVPCNIASMLKVRNGALEWTQIMRSNDIQLGLPHNFVQFTTLQEVMAGWLGLEVGGYAHLSDSLHAYERDLNSLRAVETQPVPVWTDSLALPKVEADIAWRDLFSRMSALAAEPALSLGRWKELVFGFAGAESLRNLFLVAAADDARRRGFGDEAEKCAVSCTSPVLRLVWARWLSRQVVESEVRPDGSAVAWVT